MDPITRAIASAAAGAAAAGEGLYVDEVFSTYLYEGNGGTQTITNGIDLSGEGGLVWFKNRGGSNHGLVDTERTRSSVLFSNQNAGSATSISTADLTSFNSDGFSIGPTFQIDLNTNGESMCSWTFRKAPGFFDVVTYTGTGSVRTIAHSLGSVPGMILIKGTSSALDWQVYHRSTGPTKNLVLNSTVAANTSSTRWNNTAPTASVFTLGTAARVNAINETYVAYIFAHDDQSFGTNSDEAIIKCGSYSSTGFVDLGFEPQWVMIKSTDNTSSITGDWRIFDNMRGIVSGDGDAQLFANTSGVEDTTSGATAISLNATGFTVEGQGNYGTSTIYMAIRRPHKPPTAATEVFALDATSASGSTGNAFDAPFPVDMEWHQNWGAIIDKYVGARLMSGKYLRSNSNSQELSGSSMTFDSMDGVLTAFGTTDYSAQMFKRAPGFFDVVVYSGSSSVQNIPHNLQVEPELMIIKIRGRNFSWDVYNKPSGNTKYLQLNTNNGHIGNPAPMWNQTTPTSTHFTVGTNAGGVNYNGDTHIAYLFASLDGISKVGSYTGTGSAINVDCGFSAGARFVLIKRTDSTGDWYMWDTAHGIVSGNDPYILLNSSSGQVTNTDYIDPLNAGFTVTSSAPAALNTSGGTYLFLAIA